MQSWLYRWVGALLLGLWLVGCGTPDKRPDGGSPVVPPDRTAPAVPLWEGDNPTHANVNTVTLRARTSPGEQVEFFSDRYSVSCLSLPVQKVRADDTGLATASFTVADNSTTYFRAKARDDAGNVSNCSETHTYQEDSHPPKAPQWAAQLPTRSSSNTLTLKVVVEERGSRVSLFASGDCTGPALATVTTSTSNETLSFQRTVVDDTTNLFSVSAVDEVGNTSGCSTAFTFIEDSTPPQVPVLNTTQPVSPSSGTYPYILGVTEPGATVFLYTTEQCSVPEPRSGTADAQGLFRIQVGSLGENATHSVRARARDGVGNLSGCSNPLLYTTDNIRPAEPTFQRFLPAPPANDNMPRLIGTSEPGTKVWIYSGDFCRGMPVASATTDAQGLFQATLSLVDDVTLNFSALAEDAAGNAGYCHVSFLQYTEDSTAPTVATGVKLSPSGPSNTNTVTLSGTSEGASTALLFTTPDCQGTPVAQASASGGFILGLTVPDDSTTVLSVALRDTAGNTSACAGPWTYVEDSTPPRHAGGRVVDGPAEDLSYQLTGNEVEAHWEGFADALTSDSYEHVLSTSPACSTGAVTSSLTLQATRVRLEGLGLSERTYFHCVRARDEAGNKSPWVASNGFRVDLSPPSVASTTPQPAASEVDILTPIRFTFSEPVDTRTVTSGSLTVSILGAPVAGTVSCESATTCAFIPTRPLPYREQVDVMLTPEVKDLAGRALASPHGVSFTTRGRLWSREPLPVQLARPGLSPDVAMDGQGQVLAVWSQGLGDTFRPYAARYRPFVGWEEPVSLDLFDVGNAEQLAVAMNAAGRAVAVWVLRHGARADLYAAEYVPGEGWSAPREVESRGELVSTPRVAVDGAGNGLVVWRQSDGTAESLWAARLRVGMGWNAPLLLESDAGATSVPALAAIASGEALVAWTQADAGGTVSARASRFAPDTGWTVPERLAAVASEAPVATALSLDGSALLVFRAPVGPAPSVSAFAARYVPGQGWGTALELGPALSWAEEPSVAMDRWGRALAAWTGPGSTSPQAVQVRRFTPEGGWMRLVLETGTSGQPLVVADGQGNFHLHWVENASGVDRVMQVRYPEGSIALGTPQALEPQHAGTSKRPRAVANAAGGAAVVWYRDNGTGFSGNLVYSSLYQ